MGVYILKILEEYKTSLKEFTKEVEMYPQKMVNIKNVNKEVLKNPEIVKLVDEVRSNLPEDSLLLVRPSGTEPLVRNKLILSNIWNFLRYKIWGDCKDEKIMH